MDQKNAHPLYQELPDVVLQGLQSSGSGSSAVLDPKAAARDFITLHSKKEIDKEALERHAVNCFILKPTWKKFAKKPFVHPQAKKSKYQKEKTHKKCLSGQAKRRLGLHMVNPTNKVYADFIPFYELWLEYAMNLLGIEHFTMDNWSGSYEDSRTATVQNKFKKIEFFGSKLSVTRSKCPSLVGATGIVIKETKSTFTIICEDNNVKVLPKVHSEFKFVIGDIDFTILGSHLYQRPVERARHNFKKHSLWL
ncbi:Ribonuclease P protein component 1 [Trinorchestia longiramus]|nr:Ribonuclease P protein component 1 [Trinorchestia longiramus]